MNSLVELRAISLGADSDLVEAVGADCAIQLLTEGANIQALKLNMSNTMKSAKANMKQAKSYMKQNNNDAAKKSFDAAIKDLETLKTEAEKIDDDHLIIMILDAFIRGFIPAVGLVCASGMPGITLAKIIFSIGTYVCAMSKIIFSGQAIKKNLTSINHQGENNTEDKKVWWKAGTTRGEVMEKLDRMIKTCEKNRGLLNSSK